MNILVHADIHNNSQIIVLKDILQIELIHWFILILIFIQF